MAAIVLEPGAGSGRAIANEITAQGKEGIPNSPGNAGFSWLRARARTCRQCGGSQARCGEVMARRLEVKS